MDKVKNRCEGPCACTYCKSSATKPYWTPFLKSLKYCSMSQFLKGFVTKYWIFSLHGHLLLHINIH